MSKVAKGRLFFFVLVQDVSPNFVTWNIAAIIKISQNVSWKFQNFYWILLLIQFRCVRIDFFYSIFYETGYLVLLYRYNFNY